MSKRKGKTGELELASLLSDRLDIEISRNLAQTRDGGHDLIGVGPFALEVKRSEILKINEWWKQAVSQVEGYRNIPALAYRQSRKPWRFIVPLSSISYYYPINYSIEYSAQLSIDGFCELVDIVLRRDPKNLI